MGTVILVRNHPSKAASVIVDDTVFEGTVTAHMSGPTWHDGAGEEQVETLSQASTVGSSWMIPDEATWDASTWHFAPV